MQPDVDPWKAIAIVVVIGLLIGGIGVGAILYAMKSFAEERGPKWKPAVILGTLVVFVITCCLVLFMFSFVRR